MLYFRCNRRQRKGKAIKRGIAAQSHGTLARRNSVNFVSLLGSRASTLAGLPKAENQQVFGFLFGDLIMTFKKYLRISGNSKAQASLEYFILFAVIALMTILTLTTFPQRIVSSTQGGTRRIWIFRVRRDGFFQSMLGQRGLNVDNDPSLRP
jgi:hypothetical protein